MHNNHDDIKHDTVNKEKKIIILRTCGIGNCCKEKIVLYKPSEGQTQALLDTIPCHLVKQMTSCVINRQLNCNLSSSKISVV